jgi:hypothetical protein
MSPSSCIVEAFSGPSSVLIRVATLSLLLSAAGGAIASPIEQMIGGIEAVIAACGPVDPKSAKTGAELLERERVQNKLDLQAIRNTEGYRSIYNAEVNRLLALTPKARQLACQSVW